MFDRRLLGTVIIWISLMVGFIVLGTASATSPLYWDATAIAITLIVAATLTTGSIWLFGGDSKEKEPSRKAKHQASEASQMDARMQLFMQLLDEEEKRRLRARLLNQMEASDGEIPVEAYLESSFFEQQ